MAYDENQQQRGAGEGRWQGMKHIYDDELRAYAHNTLLHRAYGSDEDEMRVIKEHLALCSHCRERHAAITFADTESVLRSYMHTSASYPSIATQVMRQAQGQTLPERRASPLSGWRFVSIPSGLVLVGVFLMIVTLIAVAYIAHPSGNGSSSLLKNKTQGTNNTVMPPLAVQTGAPFISICHQPKEVALKRLYICGHNFIPGSSVELIISMPDAATTLHKIVMIEKDGTLQYTLSIASCKYVPATITALGGNVKAEYPIDQQKIQFGTCPPVSGVVGTPEPRASWLLPALKPEYRKGKITNA